jgi:membrane-bound serine protease (ClpP class)
MKTKRLILILSALIGFIFFNAQPAAAQEGDIQVIVLEAEGPLTPAMLEYLQRGITRAERSGAELLVLQLNTPGGETGLMSRMIQAIRSSPVPVVVYVAPTGGMAASAGTMITLAGHAAAMAPQTTIGAASPVGMQGEDLGETMEAKIKNDMKAVVRGLAASRGEEAVAFAERTIDEAEAATAEEALEVGLVDYIAPNLPALLEQLDGHAVQMPHGAATLETTGAEIVELQVSFIESLLGVLTNPNIVFLLIAIGVQAILIEISNPGGWVAGFIGVVCLGLAVYGLGVLPVNWFGVLFLGLAFVLFILDIKAPTHGALTAAGVGSLIVGALVLFNSPNVPDFQRVSVPLVIGTSLVTGAMFFILLLIAIRAQKTPVRMGHESLIGRTGIVQIDLNPEGIVHVAGEQWTAQAEKGEEPLPSGARVRVVGLSGLKLIVRKLS